MPEVALIVPLTVLLVFEEPRGWLVALAWLAAGGYFLSLPTPGARACIGEIRELVMVYVPCFMAVFEAPWPPRVGLTWGFPPIFGEMNF